MSLLSYYNISIASIDISLHKITTQQQQYQRKASTIWRGPAQDVPFFYTPSHLSELKSFKAIISTNIYGISYLNSVQHSSGVEFCYEQFYFIFYRSRGNQPKVFSLWLFLVFFNNAHFYIYFSLWLYLGMWYSNFPHLSFFFTITTPYSYFFCCIFISDPPRLYQHLILNIENRFNNDGKRFLLFSILSAVNSMI